MVSRSIEDQLLNPRPGSACARARDFGIDQTLSLGRLQRTPDDRLRDLQRAMTELELFRTGHERKQLLQKPARSGTSVVASPTE